jgi:hypothetical protein
MNLLTLAALSMTFGVVNREDRIPTGQTAVQQVAGDKVLNEGLALDRVKTLGGHFCRQEGTPGKPIWMMFFSGAKVTDEKLKLIQDMTTLELLSLVNTRITDNGLKHLKRLTKLKVLWLSKTRITDRGLKFLEGMRDLRSITLTDTKVTDEGVKALQKALPELDVDR